MNSEANNHSTLHFFRSSRRFLATLYAEVGTKSCRLHAVDPAVKRLVAAETSDVDPATEETG